MNRSIPIGSVSMAPLSEETRRKLQLVGVSDEELACQSELWGQSVLSLHESSEPDQPGCYATGFDPGQDLCHGCVFMPWCWSDDVNYLRQLRAGKVDPPPGVPQHVVEHRVKRAAPPKKKRPPPR